ncbi:hypothetical protein [Vulgatibacter sp.]|uniref:hypothetical protein n=1 Tax=Vulgatibacter sp. TaxID=1971226 RepID=UPI00356327D5
MNVEDFVIGKDEGCVSDLTLDRFLAGELEETPEGMQVQAHLATCSRCAGRKASFEADAERFDEEIFVQGLAAQAARKAKAPARRIPFASIMGAVAAAAAVVLVVVLPKNEEMGYRSKGGGALELIARTQDGNVERVLPGDPLAPGDAIRFEVSAPEEAWVAIVGVDSAQVVTPYVQGASLPAGEQVLPGSIVLDETLGAERIVAVFCDGPVATEKLVDAGKRALAAAGGDPAAVVDLAVPDCRQSSVLIRKVERR